MQPHYPQFDKVDFVRPLGSAEKAFIEVLLTRFILKRKVKGEGVELNVAFNDQTLALWNRSGREAIYEAMKKATADFELKVTDYKAKLENVLFTRKRCGFSHNDPTFPFRWASAGALPVLNIDKKEYYCLFFRDVFPIGWNVANGATDTTDELIDPLQALDRELGEELVIVDPDRKKRYVLRPDKDTLLDRPEFAVFRRHWREQYPEIDINGFRVAKLPLRWEDSPDRFTVRMGKRLHSSQPCFININAKDFGIEVDRIARITVNKRLVLCDGETTAHHALNRPVALFDLARLQTSLRAGQTSFVPAKFYHGGIQYPGSRITPFLKTVLLPEIKKWRRKQDLDRFIKTPEKDRLRLCPVTESIIRRHIECTPEGQIEPTNSYDVFLSYALPDHGLARVVYEGLQGRGPRVFFALRSHEAGTWNRAIYSALSSSKVLVSVASKPEYLQRSWPQYEIDAFHMSHLDDPGATMIAFVQGFDRASLPLPLRSYRAISATKGTINQAIGQLLTLLLSLTEKKKGPERNRSEGM
jgi:hypothetical protein